MFQTMNEVLEYMDHDRLECLVCHALFLSLGIHITKTHDMALKDYHLRFGIPMGIGLDGREVIQGKRAAMERRRATGFNMKPFVPGGDERTRLPRNWVPASVAHRAANLKQYQFKSKGEQSIGV